MRETKLHGFAASMLISKRLPFSYCFSESIITIHLHLHDHIQRIREKITAQIAERNQLPYHTMGKEKDDLNKEAEKKKHNKKRLLVECEMFCFFLFASSSKR